MRMVIILFVIKLMIINDKFVQFVFKIKRDTLSDVPHVVCANAIRQSMSVTMATCNAGRWAKQGYRYQFSELGYSQTLQL